VLATPENGCRFVGNDELRRHGRTEECDHGRTDNSREVHRARVVRDDEVAVGEHTHHFGNRRASNEVGRLQSGEFCAHPRILCVSQKNDLAVVLQQFACELGVVSNGPPLERTLTQHVPRAAWHECDASHAARRFARRAGNFLEPPKRKVSDDRTARFEAVHETREFVAHEASGNRIHRTVCAATGLADDGNPRQRRS